MDNIYESKDYKRSRTAYMCQCTFEYLISIVVSDAFLAKILSDIGMSDALTGIISSFISLAFLLQMVSLFTVSRIKNVKRTATFFNTFGAVLFMCLYLIPLMHTDGRYKTVLIIGAILAAYFSNYLVTSIIFKWGNSFVSPARRGTYSAAKEMVSLIAGILFTLAVGYIFDRYEAAGNVHGGFLFMAAAIGMIIPLNLISLLMIKKGEKEKSETVAFKEVIANTMRNKNFVCVIIMQSLWNAALYLTAGFLGIYKTKDLMISVGTVQVINMAANLCRFSVSMPFGRFANRFGFTKGLELGYTIAAAAFFINIFCTPDTWWCIIIYTVLHYMATASINQNSLNIVYSYVKEEYFVQASAIKNSIAGIVGFAASLAGSRILAHIQSAGNSVFGMHIYGQQVLSLISFFILIGVIVFVHFVVAKQKAMIQ
ncbi:MAG: MFS transporter [Clostridiales bacterium]|nr:MFS transporter [Clostridiales bacterium]